MSWRFNSLVNRRAIIDRRAVSDALAEIAEKHDRVEARREAAAALVKAAMVAGRAELQRRLLEHPSRGLEAAAGYAFLTDQMLRVIFDFTITALYPDTNRTASERITLIAVGGYGRGVLAPFSDLDLLFLRPWKPTPRIEQVTEFIHYVLWDLGLKVGSASRSVGETLDLARVDMTVRTTLLEARVLAGDAGLGEGDDAPIVAGFASTAGFPAVAHVDTATWQQKPRGGTKVLVICGNHAATVQGGQQIDLAFIIRHYATRVRAAVKA